MSMTSKRAADILGMAVTFNGCGRCTSDELREAVRLAAAALQEKAEREDPKPLTLDELWQMNGEAVWMEILNGGEFWMPQYSSWVEVKACNYQKSVEFWLFGSEEELDPNPNNYGKTWICYRHKPKEVTE